jgi:hypothetical protein
MTFKIKQTRQIDKFAILFVMRGIDWKLDEDSPHKCVVEPYYLELEYAVFIRGRNCLPFVKHLGSPPVFGGVSVAHLFIFWWGECCSSV